MAAYVMWLGDMLMKKTVVRLGSMLRSIHFAHVLSTSLYATGRSTSTYSVAPWSNDPFLSRPHTHIFSPRSAHNQLLFMHICCQGNHLQDFHVEGVEPPDVGVEDEVVDAEPVVRVLGDGVPLDDAVRDAVHLRVVRVRLHQERRPVELHRRVVLLHAHTPAALRDRIHITPHHIGATSWSCYVRVRRRCCCCRR
uniref:Uncharacterized protein n=1 Tax=Oryza brachyantha TaxID=4533 RepID=J3LMS7_ORYBR